MKHLQHAEHRDHADVELHRGEQRAGARRRGFVRFRQPAVERRESQFSAQPEKNESQSQALPAVFGRGQRGRQLVDLKTDLDAAQVGRLGQAHEAEKSDRQRRRRVEHIAPGDFLGRLRVAAGDQRRGAQRADFDQRPHQDQMVGEDAQIEHHHERQRQRCTAADVTRQPQRAALARKHIDADAEKNGVDQQHEEQRGGIEHQKALGKVERQFFERMGDKDRDRAQPGEQGDADQRRTDPAVVICACRRRVACCGQRGGRAHGSSSATLGLGSPPSRWQPIVTVRI